jgi:hypothetical protein
MPNKPKGQGEIVDVVALTLPHLGHAQTTGDLAGLCKVLEPDLRRALVRAGYPVDISLLRDMLFEEGLVQDWQPIRLSRSITPSLDEAIRRQVVAQEFSPVLHQKNIRLTVPDSAYLSVFTSDWHIGEAGTNHELLLRDTHALAELKQEFGAKVRLILNGDYIGGYMSSKTPDNSDQILQPDEQRSAALELIDMLDYDLLVEADHDSWHTRDSSKNLWLSEYARRRNRPYALWGATLEYSGPVGSSRPPTRVLVHHRHPGSTKTNPRLPHINLHLAQGPADIVALAHIHSFPGAGLVRSKRASDGSFVAVQSGTYKLQDDYAKKLGLGNGEYGVPSVLVIPETGERIGFDSFQEGAAALERVLSAGRPKKEASCQETSTRPARRRQRAIQQSTT